MYGVVHDASVLSVSIKLVRWPCPKTAHFSHTCPPPMCTRKHTTQRLIFSQMDLASQLAPILLSPLVEIVVSYLPAIQRGQFTWYNAHSSDWTLGRRLIAYLLPIYCASDPFITDYYLQDAAGLCSKLASMPDLSEVFAGEPPPSDFNLENDGFVTFECIPKTMTLAQIKQSIEMFFAEGGVLVRQPNGQVTHQLKC